MKKGILLLAGAVLTASTWAGADEIVEARADHAVGGGFGALTGFMIGAVGGPVGALVGGGLGWLAGGGVQKAAGLGHTLYVVEAEDGSTRRVRTSDEGLRKGQQVVRKGAQLSAVSQ